VITHEILRDKCRKAMGAKVPMAAKERWSIFNKEQRTEFTFRYEWIRDPRFFDWVYQNSGHGKPLDIKDGSEWFGVYICEPETGNPINEY